MFTVRFSSYFNCTRDPRNRKSRPVRACRVADTLFVMWIAERCTAAVREPYLQLNLVGTLYICATCEARPHVPQHQLAQRQRSSRTVTRTQNREVSVAALLRHQTRIFCLREALASSQLIALHWEPPVSGCTTGASTQPVHAQYKYKVKLSP
jgi:hypothetical protein